MWNRTLFTCFLPNTHTDTKVRQSFSYIWLMSKERLQKITIECCCVFPVLCNSWSWKHGKIKHQCFLRQTHIFSCKTTWRWSPLHRNAQRSKVSSQRPTRGKLSVFIWKKTCSLHKWMVESSKWKGHFSEGPSILFQCDWPEVTRVFCSVHPCPDHSAALHSSVKLSFRRVKMDLRSCVEVHFCLGTEGYFALWFKVKHF